jgi:hypothetical protein
MVAAAMEIQIHWHVFDSRMQLDGAPNRASDRFEPLLH